VAGAALHRRLHRGVQALHRLAASFSRSAPQGVWDQLAERPHPPRRSDAGGVRGHCFPACLTWRLAIEAVATHDATWLRIHPFTDGNGRAARVLANWMLARYWHPAGTVTGRPDGSRGRHHAGDRHRRWSPQFDCTSEEAADDGTSCGTGTEAGLAAAL